MRCILYNLKRDNFKEIYKAKGFKQPDVAKGIGVSLDTVKSWTRTGSTISPDETNIKSLIKFLQCRIEDIAEIDPAFVQNNDEFDDIIMVPMVNIKAGAGAEGLLPDFISSERIPIWTKLLNGVNPKNLTMFQVVGDSMAPDISPDDWVMIDMVNGRHFDPVDAIYLINRDGSIQIKRLAFKGAKGIDIISTNKEYRIENTITDNIELFVIGKLYRHIRTLGALAIKE